MKEGVPFRMEGSGTLPQKAKHHLNQQETRMAIDKIAQFCMQGHMAGPIHKWKCRRDLRFISTFARYQASDLITPFELSMTTRNLKAIPLTKQ